MNDLLPLLTQLIACPSITPLDAGCQIIIEQRLKALGFHSEPLRFGEVDNLWARYGTEKPLLVFAGHTDVVPPGPLNDWQSPPFEPEVRDGYLYGRGACDMKGSLACMIVAAEMFIRQYPSFSGSLGFLITSDEEGPAINGTRKVIELLNNRQEKIDYCIIGEPSSDAALGDQIRVGRRGSLHGRLIIHGKQGHVAHPHLAKNAIHVSLSALQKLVGTEWDQGNADFPKTTFQITNIHGGTGATNVIPGHLEVLFNFRFSTAITIEELKSRVEDILKQAGLTYDLEWQIGALPFLTQKTPLTSAVQNAIQTCTGLTTRLSTGGGTSDGRFIAPTGTSVVELGVLHATAHQANECVSVEDLKTLTQIYLTILKTMFHQK